MILYCCWSGRNKMGNIKVQKLYTDKLQTVYCIRVSSLRQFQ